MKTTTTLIATALIAFSIPLQGQDFTTDAKTVSVPDDKVNEYTHRDQVGSDMSPTTDMDVAMERSVMHTARGYEVRVVSPDGTLRMSGIYADAGLFIEQGRFNYYYPNGRLESTGMFLNGLKKGVWERLDAQGHDKAERIYGPGSYEELALEHGWVTMPQTLSQ